MKIIIFRFSQDWCFSNLANVWLPKSIHKIIKDHLQTMKKSSLKTTCFSTSIFSGFGLDFGGSWASKMEPSWLLLPQKTLGIGFFFYDLKLDVFTKWRLGGLRARFWRPRASILEGPGLIFEGFGRHIWNHERQERPKTCKNKSSITRWPDRQRVGGRR